MIYLAIGRRLRGKTTWTEYHARKVAQRIHFDPRRQLQRQDALTATTSDDVEIAIDRMVEDPTIRDLIVVPGDDPQPVFDTVCSEVRRWIEHDDTRPLAFVIDEARFVQLKTAQCQWIFRCSPPEVVHVFISAHRPTDLATDVRAIADHWILFHTTQEQDLESIRERCGAEVVEHVRALGQHECVHWNDGTGEWHLHDDPKRWYVPLRENERAHTKQLRLVDEGRIVGQGKLSWLNQ